MKTNFMFSSAFYSVQVKLKLWLRWNWMYYSIRDNCSCVHERYDASNVLHSSFIAENQLQQIQMVSSATGQTHMKSKRLRCGTGERLGLAEWHRSLSERRCWWLARKFSSNSLGGHGQKFWIEHTHTHCKIIYHGYMQRQASASKYSLTEVGEVALYIPVN